MIRLQAIFTMQSKNKKEKKSIMVPGKIFK